jgi:hypothetical protein
VSGADATQVRLVDAEEGQGRTTATLVASLTARLAALHMITGADAIGSILAGFSALGRDIAKTSEGERILRAIEAGRAGANGDLLWSMLMVDQWVSSYPPTPMLDHLRNDMALVLADDLLAILELLPIPPETASATAEAGSATFAECILGMWAFSRELVRGVEMLADPTLSPAGTVEVSDATGPEPESRLLR